MYPIYLPLVVIKTGRWLPYLVLWVLPEFRKVAKGKIEHEIDMLGEKMEKNFVIRLERLLERLTIYLRDSPWPVMGHNDSQHQA